MMDCCNVLPLLPSNPPFDEPYPSLPLSEAILWFSVSASSQAIFLSFSLSLGYWTGPFAGRFKIQRKLVSPLQVIHLPLCGIFYFPWHRHQIKGTTAVGVFSERHRQMWGERNCLSFETAVGGTEPPSPRLTVRRSTTRPPLLVQETDLRGQGMRCSVHKASKQI